ncbi:single-stranded DNA-binding protein [Streptomyces sp. NRRL S-87]|uniref:single-stranded DNA-binding protein n=1 Tax=Streptomyces sp. NRRL S-87 TaxID=1463920 RepID=UPI0004BE8C16|nr:single-stranded DNA-binding protein [Streptomyces sp. NRRL S-87]
MHDTLVTLMGNAATAIDYREAAAGAVARFRLAVQARYWDRQKQAWTDGPTSFYTVWARRALAANLAGSVSVGEPLVVYGRLRVREKEGDEEGKRWFSADVDAWAVGHDLSRGTSAFRRLPRGELGLMGPQKAAVV